MTCPAFPSRCEAADLIRWLAPGLIVGVYDGRHWIDWDVQLPTEMAMVPVSRLGAGPTGLTHRFCCVIDTEEQSPSNSSLGSSLGHLLGRSRGVALVSSRVGLLLRWSHRLLLHGGAAREKVTGPYRPRASGALCGVTGGTLRLVEPVEVARSAMLSVWVDQADTVVSILGTSFPEIQAESRSAHLPLDGHHPEEVLGRLRESGIRVSASAVWYSLLQAPPVFRAG